MKDGTATCLTERHLTLFGRLIQSYARHEVLIEEIMAKVSGADATSIKLLTSGLSFTQKHDALFNLLSHRMIPRHQIDQIGKFLAVLQTYSLLRNDITHSVWVEDEPQNMIRPAWLSKGPKTAIRPEHDIDKAAKEFRASYDDLVTYTTSELEDIVNILESNCRSFREYCLANDLVIVVIDGA